MAQTSPEPEADERLNWTGLPSGAVVRASAALAAVAVLAVVGGFILGEYEFDAGLSLPAGLVFGLVLGEVCAEAGRRRTRPVAAVCGVLAGGGVLLAGWISAGEGLRPIPGWAWLAALVAAVVAGVRVAGLRRPPA